jgi:hypothetical protein
LIEECSFAEKLEGNSLCLLVAQADAIQRKDALFTVVPENKKLLPKEGVCRWVGAVGESR